MIPEVGFSEMVVIGVVALLVVGPKDLPILLKKLGEFVRKLRNMASDFRHSFDEMARQSELDELRKEVDALRSLNPVNDIKAEIEKAADLGESYYGSQSYTPFVSSDENATQELEAPIEIAHESVEKPARARKARTKKSKVEDVG